MIVRIYLFLFFIYFGSSCQNNFKQNLYYKNTYNTKSSIDSSITSIMNQYNIPGLAIGIVSKDSIFYTKGYGFKNSSTLEPVTATSNFHTASISKLFTAQAIMQLVDQHLIGLNDSLIQLLPDLSFSDNAIKNITIQSLLNHTSGLKDYNSYHWSHQNQDKNSLKNFLIHKKISLKYPPHQKYYYSNWGYDLLGLVVEKTTNTPFEVYVKDSILIPNQMNQSDFRYFLIPDSIRTSPHSKQFITKSVYVLSIYPYTREHAPSSTLNASVVDLSLWMIHFMQQLQSTDSTSIYHQMTTSSTSIYKHIGLGFQLGNYKNFKTVGHFGGDKGFRSFLLMVPKLQLGVVVLGNCDYHEDFRQEIVYSIIDYILSKK